MMSSVMVMVAPVLSVLVRVASPVCRYWGCTVYISRVVSVSTMVVMMVVVAVVMFR